MTAAFKRIGLLAALALGGCSSFSTAGVFVLPDKYAFLTCKELAEKGKSASERERQITDAMEKASTGTGGFLVNVVAYRSDLAYTRADLQVIRDTERDKKCPPAGR